MQGRIETAKKLAAAEQWARCAGVRFAWETSDANGEHYPLWDCVAYTYKDGEPAPLGTIDAVDFGPDGTPSGNPYARVVCAQMALDAMKNFVTA